ncbi:hypothetical protein [Piscirickettsia salmonis]|uniref:hypothetical protein n=1 Tax=Piscirickettsia salmonis TaxID=1238 RepID=UPI003AB0F213
MIYRHLNEKDRFISNNGYQRETRSDQLLEHLAFLLARLAVRLNGTPHKLSNRYL